LIDLLDGLNPAQREAVQTVEGPLLVHAGPGSGKTRVITHRIAYLVQNARVNPHHIMAVSFSKKAAEEMKRRLDELLGPIAEQLTVGTFHSACLRILRREGIPGLGATFEVYDEEDQRKLVKQCMEKAGLSTEDNDLRRIKAGISYAKTRMVNPDDIIPKQGDRFDDAMLMVYHGYQKLLKKQRALDYDDMLVYTYKLLKENDGILRKYQQLYRYILVDEFQDTSTLQYQIIKSLGAKYRNVCVVGDPDQTIYSWRQAEIGNIHSFQKDFPGTRVIGMEENYRSTGTIVDAANALIANNRFRKEKRLSTSRDKGEPIAVIKLDDEGSEAAFVTREIKRLAEERSQNYNDFAVLYRVNAQSRALEEAFNESGIPYRLVGGTPFYKRREVMDMIAWLRVMRNQADDAGLTRVIKVGGKGIGPQTLTELQAEAEKSKRHLYQVLEKAAAGIALSLAARTQRAVARFYALLEELHTESKWVSIVTLMNRIIEKTGYQDYLKGEDGWEERWENVLELMSLASAYEHLSPIEALNSLLQKISQASEAADRKQEARATVFHTLHGAKGTEFPIVFIVGVEEGLLPHSKSMENHERLEEERRLCYVGITRAMELVYLTHAEKRHPFGEISFRMPSRFIRELPVKLVIIKDLTRKE